MDIGLLWQPFRYFKNMGQAVVYRVSWIVNLTMRLDKFLKVSRLIKRRTVANEACDAGRISVNGKVAKASLSVKEGDIIEIGFGNKNVKVEVLDVQETVKKDVAKELYRYL
ncbi:Ribosomal 50S subunit-recycling heat shock protein, contains S4 domain [Anaeromicropila populeti]|uniref:RQC P-site tRNA stabilizing factor n=2 Tax=Anaeromicropila populeti TaxID=37658 RepID=A0A1I6IZH3_9FIRM|nr:Ribosomal 50S subunit-recycling heat shock protein, contains S4 domain [Anaeromicropila populeti]